MGTNHETSGHTRSSVRDIPDYLLVVQCDNRDVKNIGRVAIGLGVLAWGLLFTITSHTPIGLYWFSFVGAAWAFVGAGLVAWLRRPKNRTGLLMVATGLLFLFPTLVATRIPALWTIGFLLQNVSGLGLFYLVLAYPRGILTTRTARALFWYTVAVVSVLSLSLILVFDPRAFPGCEDCPRRLNLLLIRNDPELFRLFLRVLSVFIIIDFAWLLAFVTTRFVRASQPMKRTLWPVYLPMSIFGLMHIYLVALNLTPEGIPNWTNITAWIVASVLMLTPITFLFGLLRLRARRARLGNLVVELGTADPSLGLKDAVAKTLGDPSVEVGFWIAESARYVTAEGKSLTLPATEDDKRAVTHLQRGGQPLAAIVHDVALLEDPSLVSGVAAAAQLAVENERLQAQVRTQLEEVRASRQRIVEAADNERRKVERALHDGAQQRLVKLSLTLRLASERLTEVRDSPLEQLLDEGARELQLAQTELRELAQGIHPVILTQEGLGPAIEALAELSPVPVRIEAPPGRFPQTVEATAYFVASEALANVAKHARATRASVTVTATGRRLTLKVEDDGVGGANEMLGSGLRGLTDRVAALDGSIRLESPSGGGTRLFTEIPCG